MLQDRNWHGTTGALPRAIGDLRAAAPAGLPEGYLQLLSVSDGGEGPLPVSPFTLCLDPVQEVLSRLSSGNYERSEFDGFLIFGGNGGGEYLALDMRQGTPWPVVAIDMVAGADSAEVVTSDFDEFIQLIGQDSRYP